MISTFTCLHCGCTFPCHPCVKDQNYCNAKECRRASRRAWKNKKYKTNKSYRQKCLDSQKSWREKNPGYQKQYRKGHSDYVARCYESQKEHYKRRRETDQKAIDKNNVNRNTLFSNPRRDGVYELIPVDGEKNNVNRNTLVVRIQILSG